jgi:hypothetical protein
VGAAQFGRRAVGSARGQVGGAAVGWEARRHDRAADPDLRVGHKPFLRAG